MNIQGPRFQRNNIIARDGPTRCGKALNLIFSKLSSQNMRGVASITQRFLFPVSTVPQGTPGTMSPCLCPKYNEKRVADYESRCLRKLD